MFKAVVGLNSFSIYMILQYAHTYSTCYATAFPSLHFALTPTRLWTDAYFRRFLTVLEYSPIGEKFPPTTAPPTLYTIKKVQIFLLTLLKFTLVNAFKS
jgi:hypothetical protein